MNNLIVGDADSLVALAHKEDSNHKNAQNTVEVLLAQGYQIIYPNTAILEAVTALKRSLNLPDKAHLVAKQYLTGAFTIEYIDEELQKKATKLFDEQAKSKKNTIFDAVVATLAEQLNAEAILSFDKWYPKLGLKLATELTTI